MNDRRDITSDVHDSPRDRERMQPEEVILDLPDVTDIPGQEYIQVPKLGEFADVTASSDDEEGRTIKGFDDEDEDDEANVTEEERELLERTLNSTDSDDEEDGRRAELDSTDADGDPLNEAFDVSGGDLDVPGSEDDDDNEELGEEDEENNSYSLGGEKD